MNRDPAAGNTFASPSDERKASYAALVSKIRRVGRSPSSGRWPRSWNLTLDGVAAAATSAAHAITRMASTEVARARRKSTLARRRSALRYGGVRGGGGR